jgi:hypothetical protein
MTNQQTDQNYIEYSYIYYYLDSNIYEYYKKIYYDTIWLHQIKDMDEEDLYWTNKLKN